MNSFFFFSVRRSPRQGLVQVRRQAVAQLAGVGSEVDADLLELVDHLAGCRLVAAELARLKPFPLLAAADDGPHEQVGHVDGHRLRQRRESGRVGPDHARVASGREREDVEVADFLSFVIIVSTRKKK